MSQPGISGVSGLIPALGQALQMSTLQQRALAGDLANADTPGYSPQNVTFAGLLRTQMGLPAGPNPLASVTETDPGLMANNGNGVDVEATLVALQQNSVWSQGLSQALSQGFTNQQDVVTDLQGA